MYFIVYFPVSMSTTKMSTFVFMLDILTLTIIKLTE